MKRISLIDMDGLYYQALRDTLEESIEVLKSKLDNCLNKTKANYWAGFTSIDKCFRYNIDPEYKINRKNKEPQKWFKTLKQWSIEEYDLNYMKGVEADDLVCYWYHKDICVSDNYIDTREMLESALELCRLDKTPAFEFESLEKTLCSHDKDLLLGCVGKHFNYTYKDDKTLGFWVETDFYNSIEFKLSQLVIGDSADSVKGLTGKGLAYWNKIKDSIQTSSQLLSEYVLQYGQSKGIFEFQKNYRLLHILETDEDFMREIGIIPHSINVNKIDKEEKYDNLF